MTPTELQVRDWWEIATSAAFAALVLGGVTYIALRAEAAAARAAEITEESMRLPNWFTQRQLGRGVGWLLVALVGSLAFGFLIDSGVPEYTQRWLGAMFKIASVVLIGYRVTRDVLRIDPSGVTDSTAFALLHLARAIVIAAFAIAVCVAV